MTKAITATRKIILVTGTARDFPSLANSTAMKGWWDSRVDRHEDYLAVEVK